jgi:ABC-type transporter Mla subunit MlaD
MPTGGGAGQIFLNSFLVRLIQDFPCESSSALLPRPIRNNTAAHGGAAILKRGISDAWVAISVIACSIILLIALSLGLNSRFFVPDGRHVRVRFSDITGIKSSSQVKFAGAPAGAVSDVRILTAAERANDPSNLVEITLTLLPSVPPLTGDARVSISADTLLSDKFVLVENGSGAEAGPDDPLQGLAPVPFDKLTRNVDVALEGLLKLLADDKGTGGREIFSRIHRLLDETERAVTGLNPVVADAGIAAAGAKEALVDIRTAAADARALLADNKAGVTRAVARLDSAAGAVEVLAKKGESVVRDNEKGISRTVAGLRVSSENLRVTTTYSKILLRDLAERPSRLLWGGGRPPVLPTERQILEAPAR